MLWMALDVRTPVGEAEAALAALRRAKLDLKDIQPDKDGQAHLFPERSKHVKRCAECGKMFRSVRSDKETCSAKCRKRKNRKG